MIFAKLNFIRLSADLVHIIGIGFLLYKLLTKRNAAGISLKMQQIYLLVFIARYSDLLYTFVSIYNTSMKIILILSTMYIIYILKYMYPICQTYDSNADNFPIWKTLFLPSVILSLLSGKTKSTYGILWSFSIWFESVAILPQLVMLQKYRVVENLTSHYVAAMGLYRALYILNWIYRYYTDEYVNYVAWIGGIIQVALYIDFFYYYVKARIQGGKLILPYANHV